MEKSARFFDAVTAHKPFTACKGRAEEIDLNVALTKQLAMKKLKQVWLSYSCKLKVLAG